MSGHEKKSTETGHSLSGDGRGRVLSGHGKKSTEQPQGALTNWRRQREGLVRTRKKVDRARGTHSLETAERGTCQVKERNRSSEEHSLPGDDRRRDLSGHEKKSTERGHSQTGDEGGRDLSGHGKKLTERGALTSWRRHREGLVRTRKEID